MPRIAGIDIPEYKKIAFALRSIYGVGDKVAAEVLALAQVDAHKRARDVSSDELNRIQKALEQYPVEGDLRRIIADNVDRLKRIKSYRGSRHIAKLPARGQRTRTNSRTVRGGMKRRTVGSMTKEMAAKLETAKSK